MVDPFLRLIAQLLLRNESCDTVQDFRDKLYSSSEKRNAAALNQVGLESEELLTSYGYSSLPFIWNNLLSKGVHVRSIDELWRYVWANHLENVGAHKPEKGSVPLHLDSDQEQVIRTIIYGWESKLKQQMNFNTWAMVSLAVVPDKDYLVVGMGHNFLEDEIHPLTNFIRHNTNFLIARNPAHTNHITGEPLEILTFLMPYKFKPFLNSYASLRSGTAAISSKITPSQYGKLADNRGLIETELALANKEITFDYLQSLHNITLNYSK
jgi:hypothetical protein